MRLSKTYNKCNKIQIQRSGQPNQLISVLHPRIDQLPQVVRRVTTVFVLFPLIQMARNKQAILTILAGRPIHSILCMLHCPA
jgi:hypothetical protein